MSQGEGQIERRVTAEERYLLDQILINLQPPSSFVANMKTLNCRNRLRAGLRQLVGHLCASDSPLHLDADLSDDRQFTRVLRVAGGACRADPEFASRVEALILEAMIYTKVQEGASSRAAPVASPARATVTVPLRAVESQVPQRTQGGRIVTLKASGPPLYPALPEEPTTLPGTRNGGGQYLNALMPRPTDPDVATAESWLRGLAWHADVINILLDEPDGDLIDDILELETEIDRHLNDILERPGLPSRHHRSFST